MKEQMFRAEKLNHELGEIEEHLRQLDQQHADASSLHGVLDAFTTLKEGDELRVPLAIGIFAKAKFTGDHVLLANVGADVLVPKTVDEVHREIEEQLRTIEQHQRELQQQFEVMLASLDALKEGFR